MWLCHKLGKESNNGIFAEDKTAWILILGRLLPILTAVISIISASPVLDPLSCHATSEREGSRIICLRMLVLNQL